VLFCRLIWQIVRFRDFTLPNGVLSILLWVLINLTNVEVNFNMGFNHVLRIKAVRLKSTFLFGGCC